VVPDSYNSEDWIIDYWFPNPRGAAAIKTSAAAGAH
jgi:hypothetical protein